MNKNLLTALWCVYYVVAINFVNVPLFLGIPLLISFIFCTAASLICAIIFALDANDRRPIINTNTRFYHIMSAHPLLRIIYTAAHWLFQTV